MHFRDGIYFGGVWKGYDFPLLYDVMYEKVLRYAVLSFWNKTNGGTELVSILPKRIGAVRSYYSIVVTNIFICPGEVT